MITPRPKGAGVGVLGMRGMRQPGTPMAQGRGRAQDGGGDAGQGRNVEDPRGQTDRWKEDALLWLHTELMPNSRERTLNNPPVQQIS